MTLEKLKEIGEAPEWLEEFGFQTLQSGYLLPGETPKTMYHRVAKAAASQLHKHPGIENKIFQCIWNNWIGLSTPIATNVGTQRGLPVSCFGQYVDDSLDGIFKSYHETAMLTKNGGGIGKEWSSIRGRGMSIKGNGSSEGVVPWLKIEESVLQGVSQGSTRRGAGANYLDITHPDAEEFIEIRRQTGDPTRRCLSVNFHHALNIEDDFINEMLSGNKKNRNLWEKLLKARVEMGEPYIHFKSNSNKNLPEWYKKNNLDIKQSQLCNEIFLYSDAQHTFTCVLCSMNLARFDEWKNTDAVQVAILMLDAVASEFVQKAKNIPGFENAVRFTEKARALGLGALGWHTLLQSKLIAFDSFEAMQLNSLVFKTIKDQAELATIDLAEKYGEAEWTKGFKRRNTDLTAIAPTVSNSLISGGVSQGVEPIAANIYSQKSAKGTFIRKNPTLQTYLKTINKDTLEVWEEINKNSGSVKSLKFLSDHEKDVFATAREINQFAVVRQAGQRQKFISQGQSINLFFAIPKDIQDTDLRKKLGKYIHDVHMEAWQLGLKGLYYLRPESALKGDSVFKDSSDCKVCEA